ncbi:hypothetical protein [Conchiformibius kuhniae]|uniref:Uncharacterized protein n=1 Tax=Conchiformibius kuhniae TaxID=211502 RepID=A0A8T9MU94_9NEIS|nr:hypothetical protein [Conchiformibius kuhniae]UOP04859.1 hypothetical protein LVJ77_00280 [Conchiformibius kuhniae]
MFVKQAQLGLERSENPTFFRKFMDFVGFALRANPSYTCVGIQVKARETLIKHGLPSIGRWIPVFAEMTALVVLS